MSTNGKGVRLYILHLPKQYTELEGMCCIDRMLQYLLQSIIHQCNKGQDCGESNWSVTECRVHTVKEIVTVLLLDCLLTVYVHCLSKTNPTAKKRYLEQLLVYQLHIVCFAYNEQQEDVTRLSLVHMWENCLHSGLDPALFYEPLQEGPWSLLSNNIGFFFRI